MTDTTLSNFRLVDEPGIEWICRGAEAIALIIRRDFNCSAVRFFTPDSFAQQLGFIHHPAGRTIRAHLHNRVRREVHDSPEVLVIRKGALRADFYDCDKTLIESRVLRAGDVVLLAAGGHGFETLEETEIIEVKQGPYCGHLDKEPI